jgi:hypothetical protein
MKTDTARTLSTMTIWASVAAILCSLKLNGPPDMIASVFLGMSAFLSIAAAIGTSMIWRSPRAAEPVKEVHREL